MALHDAGMDVSTEADLVDSVWHPATGAAGLLMLLLPFPPLLLLLVMQSPWNRVLQLKSLQSQLNRLRQMKAAASLLTRRRWMFR
jgi:hypothetical protein